MVKDGRMGRWALFIPLAGALSGAVHAQTPTEPSPRTHPGSWASSNDYPLSARILRIEGHTIFKLEIDAEGMVTGCTIVRSSGVELLDQTTCDLMKARAQFYPARDSAGKPVAGTWTSAVRWKFPTP